MKYQYSQAELRAMPDDVLWDNYIKADWGPSAQFADEIDRRRAENRAILDAKCALYVE